MRFQMKIGQFCQTHKQHFKNIQTPPHTHTQDTNTHTNEACTQNLLTMCLLGKALLCRRPGGNRNNLLIVKSSIFHDFFKLFETTE